MIRRQGFYYFQRLFVFQHQLLLRYRTSLLEVHQVHFNSEVVQGESCKETLIRARCWNLVQLLLGIYVVLMAKMDCVGWFHSALRQVPNLEIFRLIDCKELTDTRCKPSFAVLEFLVIIGCRTLVVIKIKQTPFDLRYCSLALLVPYSYRSSILSII